MLGWCHLAASTIEELHAFAERLGVKRCWFENKRGRNQPHYDLRVAMIPKAIELGAEQVSNRELYDFLEENFYN